MPSQNSRIVLLIGTPIAHSFSITYSPALRGGSSHAITCTSHEQLLVRLFVELLEVWPAGNDVQCSAKKIAAPELQ